MDPLIPTNMPFPTRLEHGGTKLPNGNRGATIKSNLFNSISSSVGTLFLFVLLWSVAVASDHHNPSARIKDKVLTQEPSSSPWRREVILPNRIDSTGSSIHRTRHFQKRSVSYFGSESEGTESDGFHEPGEDSVLYSIEAFGEQYLIHLRKDHEFISPNYRLEVNGKGNLNESAFISHRHCFYSGSVRDHHGSYAIFSLCGGMSGLFQIQNSTQFLIEPLKPHRDQQFHEETLQKEHVIATHNPAYVAPTSGETPETCGTRTDTESSNPVSFSSQLNQVANQLRQKVNTTKSDNKDESNKIKSRRKRFQSYEHFLELMIVADKKLVDHHGDNVQHYILMLTSMVDRIFRDYTIGNSIQVLLVQRVILLPENEPGLHISPSSSSTLRSFCAWQKRQNEPNGHPHHFDTAILLTREDICRTRNNCDTLGLAELGTICDPDRSCSLVEDNGLSAAFTMAHEMGHIFNLPHDDARKCEEFGQSLHVMAPNVNKFSQPWTWSNCSRYFLTSFLEGGHGYCLWNKPTDTQALPSYLPGEVYNTSRQCSIVNGEDSTLCHVNSCSMLWCTVTRSTSGTHCSTRQLPQADGTPCELNKWCMRKRCVPRTPNAVEIHGGWGEWADFGACSRSCGGGVQHSRRECNNPVPQNGGKYCIGDRMRFRSCAIELCPAGSMDFREQQCAAYNSATTQWVAKVNGIHDNDVCKLFCQRRDNPMSFQRKGKQVIDGTACKPGGDDICVQGQCKRAGCDHRLGSDTQRDNCYECGGDNSSCRLVQGSYNQIHYGYTFVVQVPVHATKLVIEQRSYSRSTNDTNFLALKASNGRHILNGNLTVHGSLRQIKIAGVIITYSGSFQPTERITSEGKFNESIEVEVLSTGDQDQPPNMSYSFYSPITGEIEYAWDNNGPWGRCSHLCDGRKYRRLQCVRREDRTVVYNSKCRDSPPVQIGKRCNTKCFVRWEDFAQGECSSRCGLGLQQFDVRCFKVFKKSGRKRMESDEHCNPGDKPPTVRRCIGSCPLARWIYSPWTRCSRTCNNGTRVRNAICQDATGAQIDESTCTEPKHVRELCNTHRCPQWRVSRFSSCSVTCGPGEMLRTVMCYQEETRVRDELCSSVIQPERVRPCELSKCPSWQYSAWGECSVTCGTGVKTRSTRCHRYDGIQIEDTSCNPAMKPIEEMPCESLLCRDGYLSSLDARTTRKYTGQWRMGGWTECSTTCGPGIKERYVMCSNLNGSRADQAGCDPIMRPTSTEACVVAPCTYWEAGEWQECSRTCGRGVKLRSFSCRHENGQYLSDLECRSEERPETSQPCRIRSCRKRNRRWKKTKWSECSVQCGTGNKTRTVTCLNEYGEALPDSECDLPKPKTVRKCAKLPCAQWTAGSWSQCSVTCGKGQIFRPVLCVSSGQIVEDSVCRARRSNKPRSVKRCRLQECPRFKWFKGEWGECSRSCSGGQRSREVYCRNRGTGDVVDEHHCSHRQKPYTVMGCNKEPCNNLRAKWVVSQWSECSRSCGAGIQTRHAFCQAVSEQGWPIPGESDLCDPSTRPSESQECNHGGCEDNAARWVTGSWSQCSSTCGQGTQLRQVECHNRYGIRVEHCQTQRPVTSRECILRSCQQASCRDIQQLGDISEDGEYKLLIKGQFINIYCHHMSTSHPKEYITLPEDSENFSEIYSKRLLAPLQCPYKGRRNDSCACTSAGHQEAGFTTFAKVRLNITSLEIITTDSTFARVWSGVFVPFATAGDCYSAAQCPQGNFRVNLRETGFMVSSEAEWITQGYAESKVMQVTESNQLVKAHCGGYCGICRPSRLKGHAVPVDVL